MKKEEIKNEKATELEAKRDKMAAELKYPDVKDPFDLLSYSTAIPCIPLGIVSTVGEKLAQSTYPSPAENEKPRKLGQERTITSTKALELRARC